LCDSPTNYLGQPGIEFLRAIPTVWDDTVVISGEVGKSIVMARRSGEKWYLAAMNGEDAAQLPVPLSFLGKGKWELQNFADKPDGSDYQAVVESKESVTAKSTVPLSLAPAGGYAGIISRIK
jgi:alpha-glucosidase